MELASYTLIQNGAKSVFAVVSHAVLSEGALERINRSAITEIAVTNTLPLSPEAKKCPKIKVINIAPTFAEVLRPFSCKCLQYF